MKMKDEKPTGNNKVNEAVVTNDEMHSGNNVNDGVVNNVLNGERIARNITVVVDLVDDADEDEEVTDMNTDHENETDDDEEEEEKKDDEALFSSSDSDDMEVD